MLQAEKLHKAYVLGKKTIHVLAGTSFGVAEGETVSVVGLSGAGKSTLLHLLGGLDHPDQGRVVLDGQDLYRLSGSKRAAVRCRSIGFVFQSYHLLPEMDVLENVALPAMAACNSKSKSWRSVRARAMELLEQVGLQDRAIHRPQELSGGEQQRVAMARALMNEPRLVLADEPTGNLDEQTGSQVLGCLFSMAKTRGRSLVIVTHDSRVASRCDRSLRLVDGVLIPA